MAFTAAAAPLLVSVAALAAATQCRRPETQVLVSGVPVPALRTRMLETHLFAVGPPKASPELLFVSTGGREARREGGVPESLLVMDDCSVRAIWWTTHLCGLTAKGNATWSSDKRMGFTIVKMEGEGRSDCPSLVTRFETVIDGLPNGTYRFGTDRKAVEFAIGCASRK